jgi:hypothetical protein
MELHLNGSAAPPPDCRGSPHIWPPLLQRAQRTRPAGASRWRPPCSAGNGPRPSGPDREGWVRVRHNRPEWSGRREGPRVPSQCLDSAKTALGLIHFLLSLVLSWHCLGTGQAMACQTKGRRSGLSNRAGHALTGQYLGASLDFAVSSALPDLRISGMRSSWVKPEWHLSLPLAYHWLSDGQATPASPVRG